jgi:hypothetical protein
MSNTKSYDKININHSDNIVINIKQHHKSGDLDILPGYTHELCEGTYTTSDVCWNCCHSFSNQAHTIPLSYIDKVFYIYGTFCSFNCGARYIFDTYTDKNKWNLYSLLNLYYNISLGKQGAKVVPSPHRLLLEKFGGSMSIDDYRGSTQNYIMHIPPIIPQGHTIKKLTEYKHMQENKEYFKLYRTKPLNTSNNIYNTMNLTN